MERIIGLVISGLAVRAIGAGLALYVGLKAYAFIGAAFSGVSAALPL